MKTIHLIRHGQASAGTADYDRLSPLGENQAILLSQHPVLRSLKPEQIWSGSLKRQRQTALLAHPQIEHFLSLTGGHNKTGGQNSLQIHQGLNEYDHKAIHAYYHPHVQHTPDEETDLPSGMDYEIYAAIIQNWMNDSANQANKRLESWTQFSQRTLAAVYDAAKQSPGDQIALYSSGGAISAVVTQLDNLTHNEIPALIWKMNNASITTLEYQSGNLNLVQVNQITHFEAHGNTELITWI